MATQLTAPHPMLDAIEAVDLAADRIPDLEDMYLLERALASIQECLSHRVFRGVREVCDTGQPFSVSYEQIGQLVTWAQHVRARLEDIEQDVAAVALMAHDAHAMAAGYTGDGTPFSGLSSNITDTDGPYSEEQLESAFRRIGFGDDA